MTQPKKTEHQRLLEENANSTCFDVYTIEKIKTDGVEKGEKV